MAKVKLVFLPVWPAGHLTSMLEFARRLLEAANDSFTITVLLIDPPFETFSSTSTSDIHSLSSSGLDIHFHNLPVVEPPLDTEGGEDFVSLFLQSYKPHLKEYISSSSSSSPSAPVSALFIDLFETTLIDVGTEFGIPTYIYFTSTALLLGLMLHLPALEDKIDKEFPEVEAIQLPGITRPIPGISMPTPIMNKKSKIYTWFAYHGRRFREAKGIIVNTFEELEVEPLRALAEGLLVPDHSTPSIYPVGPILTADITSASTVEESNRHECLKWLDWQNPRTVIYLCFGSRGCFNAAQLKEMAEGLEKSGHPFLWIVRSPPTGGNTRELSDANLSEVLPSGFLERTRERGMVWPSWAPQGKILSHGAIGGFVTHCGWNSCFESLWFGVPMLAWPLYAEQHLNEVEMVRDLGIAVGMEVDRKNGNFVKGEELERGVRCLMGENDEEGKRVRAKVTEMRNACRRAVETGGSSYNHLKKLAEELGAGNQS